MYGLVNKGIEDLIIENFGEENWRKVKIKANVHVETFLAMESYPDEVTYNLVSAASEVLGVPAEGVLKTFGQFWIKFTLREGYGEYLKMTGTNLFEFLQKLDQMHGRLSLTFPNYEPPSFRCSDVTPTSLRLHYHSSRPGLSQFVVGIVEGLAEMYQSKAKVTTEKTRDQGHSHDEFLVELVS